MDKTYLHVVILVIVQVKSLDSYNVRIMNSLTMLIAQALRFVSKPLSRSPTKYLRQTQAENRNHPDSPTPIKWKGPHSWYRDNQNVNIRHGIHDPRRVRFHSWFSACSVDFPIPYHFYWTASEDL
jgi:hypothetical protein